VVDGVRVGADVVSDVMRGVLPGVIDSFGEWFGEAVAFTVVPVVFTGMATVPFAVLVCRDGEIEGVTTTESTPPLPVEPVVTVVATVVLDAVGATVSLEVVVTGTVVAVFVGNVAVCDGDGVASRLAVRVGPVVTGIDPVVGTEVRTVVGTVVDPVVGSEVWSVVVFTVEETVVGTVVGTVVDLVVSTVFWSVVVFTVVGTVVLTIVVIVVVGTVVGKATVIRMTWLDVSGVEDIPSLQYQTTWSPSPTVRTLAPTPGVPPFTWYIHPFVPWFFFPLIDSTKRDPYSA
jgi:hypothetical protein